MLCLVSAMLRDHCQLVTLILTNAVYVSCTVFVAVALVSTDNWQIKSCFNVLLR